ncbi:MAG: hypothetical protein Fur0032_12630 [Terrimicrobiaceae bacterium]
MKKSRKSRISPDTSSAQMTPAAENKTPGEILEAEAVVEQEEHSDHLTTDTPADENPSGDEPVVPDSGASTVVVDSDSVTEAVTEDTVEEPESLPEGVVARPLVDVIEAILFASQKPVSTKELRSIFKGAGETGDPGAQYYAKVKEPQFREALSELAFSLQERGSTYEVRETAAGWQLMTRPEFSPWLRQLFPENRPARLSAPALETLAIIAYRQPITRADIEAVRGVAVDGVMQTLLDRGLIRIGGRAEIPGRPLLYETTQFFMEHFGLRDLDELPNAAELRKVALPTAEVPPEKSPVAEPVASDPHTIPADSVDLVQDPDSASPSANSPEPGGDSAAPAIPAEVSREEPVADVEVSLPDELQPREVFKDPAENPEAEEKL